MWKAPWISSLDQDRETEELKRLGAWAQGEGRWNVTSQGGPADEIHKLQHHFTQSPRGCQWPPLWRMRPHSNLLHRVLMSLKKWVLVAHSGPTLCDPMDCNLTGSSVHGIPQVRLLEWVAMPSSRGSSWPRDQTPISCISGIGRPILSHSATWKAHLRKLGKAGIRGAQDSGAPCALWPSEVPESTSTEVACEDSGDDRQCRPSSHLPVWPWAIPLCSLRKGGDSFQPESGPSTIEVCPALSTNMKHVLS